MDLIAAGSQLPTMSSREIADLCGKRHGHVMRDIRAMLVGLGLAEDGVIQKWTDPQNKQTYDCFSLNKDLTLTLVLGYNVQARARITSRVQAVS